MCDLLKVQVLGHDTHTHAHPQTKRVPEREKKKAPIREGIFVVKVKCIVTVCAHTQTASSTGGEPVRYLYEWPAIH